MRLTIFFSAPTERKTLPLSPHKSQVFQDAQMLGDGRRTDAQFLGQAAHTQGSPGPLLGQEPYKL